MLSQSEAKPRRVVCLVSGSRSGSSLLRVLLSLSPSLVSLAGEEEVYIKASGHGYGQTSDSDSFCEMAHPSLFRRMLQTELETEQQWEWRLSHQYRGVTLCRLLDDIGSLDRTDPTPWLRKHNILGHYDACPRQERVPFKEMVNEMPPYVMPSAEPKYLLRQDTLLLKSPYNTYRPGLMESVFSGVEFSYIVLLRNPGATINGLMDGWLSPYGFHKHLTPHGWWKFDMPNGWQEYATSPLIEKCRFQWESTNKILAENWLDKGQHVVVRFEDLLSDPNAVLGTICGKLGLECPVVNALPPVMQTESPRPFRWRQREDAICKVLSRCRPLIESLGYGDTSQWL